MRIVEAAVECVTVCVCVCVCTHIFEDHNWYKYWGPKDEVMICVCTLVAMYLCLCSEQKVTCHVVVSVPEYYEFDQAQSTEGTLTPRLHPLSHLAHKITHFFSPPLLALLSKLQFYIFSRLVSLFVEVLTIFFS